MSLYSKKGVICVQWKLSLDTLDCEHVFTLKHVFESWYVQWKLSPDTSSSPLKIPKKNFPSLFDICHFFFLPKSGICYLKKSILWKGGGIERKRINLTAFYSFTFNNKSIIIIYSILFFTLYTKHTWWKIEILFIILIFYSFNIFRSSTFLFS